MEMSGLRRAVAKRIGIDDIPDYVWTRMVDFDNAQGVIEGYRRIKEEARVSAEERRGLRTEYENDLAALVDRTRSLMEMLKEHDSVRVPWDGRMRRTGEPRSTVEGTAQGRFQRGVEDLEFGRFTEYEREYALALSESIAVRVPGYHPEVAHFRTAYLGVTLLRDWESLYSFFASPLTRFVDASWLEAKGIHPLSTTVVSDEGRVDATRHRTTIRVDAHDGTPATVAWRGRRHRSLTDVLFCNTRGAWYHREVWPDSVLHKLHDITARLVNPYPWNAKEATIFVLTGWIPVVQPVGVTLQGSVSPFSEHHKIALEIEPWASAATVTQEYIAARRRIVHHDPRHRTTRPLSVLRFVIKKENERRNTGSQVESWETLVREWNKQHPDQAYESAVPYRQFQRDCEEANKQVLFFGLKQGNR